MGQMRGNFICPFHHIFRTLRVHIEITACAKTCFAKLAHPTELDFRFGGNDKKNGHGDICVFWGKNSDIIATATYFSTISTKN